MGNWFPTKERRLPVSVLASFEEAASQCPHRKARKQCRQLGAFRERRKGLVFILPHLSRGWRQKPSFLPLCLWCRWLSLSMATHLVPSSSTFIIPAKSVETFPIDLSGSHPAKTSRASVSQVTRLADTHIGAEAFHRHSKSPFFSNGFSSWSSAASRTITDRALPRRLRGEEPGRHSSVSARQQKRENSIINLAENFHTLLFASGYSQDKSVTGREPSPPKESGGESQVYVSGTSTGSMGDDLVSSTKDGKGRPQRVVGDGYGGEGLVLRPPSGKHRHTVLFFHGLGDTALGWEDLAQRLHRLPQYSDTKFILPTAPNRPVTISMNLPQHSWADIYGLTPDHPEDEAGYKESVARVRKIIDHEIHWEQILPQNIIVGGFSQGAALAYLVGLSPFRISEVFAKKALEAGGLVASTSTGEPEAQIEKGDTFTVGMKNCPATALGGIIALSGWVPLNKYNSVSPVVQKSTLSVLHLHGTMDPIVQFKWGELSSRLTKEALGEAPSPPSEEAKKRQSRAYAERVRFVPIEGLGHGACEETFVEVEKYLKDALLGQSQTS